MDRLECTNQYGAGKTFRASDGVDAPVHAVDEVHVRDSRLTVERLGALRPAGSCVACGIVLADVRFRLDNDSTCQAVGGSTLENCSKQLASYDLGLTIVEIPRKNSSH